MNRIQKIAWACILLCIVIITPNIHAGQEGPKDTVETFNTALLQAMKGGDELGFSGRYDLLTPVIKEKFALAFMGEKSVGRYWDSWQKAQQEIFLEEYTAWSIASYANNFNKYSGEQFEVVPNKDQKGRTVSVVSRLTKKNGETVGFHYRLRKMQDKWQIVDIQIKGVSQLALTRAQFVDIIKDNGFDGLINVIREKIDLLSGGPPPPE